MRQNLHDELIAMLEEFCWSVEGANAVWSLFDAFEEQGQRCEVRKKGGERTDAGEDYCAGG